MTPPPAAPADAGGGRVLAALLVIQAAFVLAFFALSIVAVWMRADRGNDAASAPVPPSWTAAPEPGGSPSGASWVAIVVMPRKDLKSGAMRPGPSFDAEPAEWIPVGAEVEVLGCDTVVPRWCRVRMRTAPAKSGWMHVSILRRK